VTNTRFDPAAVTDWIDGESKDWIFELSSQTVPPLTKQAETRGLRTAVLRWPVSLGARTQWMIPEIFPIGPHAGRDAWTLIEENCRGELCRAHVRAARARDARDHAVIDELVCETACALTAGAGCDLLFAHLTQYDHAAHEHGPDSAEAARALEASRALVMRVIAGAPAGALIVVLGDHGLMEFRRRVHVNTLLARRGWIETDGKRILAWRAIAHTNCAQAYVHLRDPELAAPVLQELRAHARGRFEVLLPAELRDLRAHVPGAVAVVDCLPGWSLGQNLRGPLEETLPAVRGEHGYLSSHPAMHAGLILLGGGAPAGASLGDIHLIDVAPTLARSLGLEMPHAEGRVRQDWLAA
jgi:hypothetical protein